MCVFFLGCSKGDGLGIYRKDTFTGQYTNFESFVPWRHKISWVRALIDRVHRICTPNKIKTELKLIRKFLSWNGFPKRIANLLIDRFTMNAQNRAPDHITNGTSHNNQHSTIWLTIPFVGDLTTQHSPVVSGSLPARYIFPVCIYFFRFSTVYATVFSVITIITWLNK